MDAPLWTETHAPAIDELPQASVRDYLTEAVDEPINLVLYGPRGVGKTAAVRALAREAHSDPDTDLIELNVADFFDRTKTEIRSDPRFEHFLTGEIAWVKTLSAERKDRISKRYKSDWSKAEMIAHVLKESAAFSPASGGYKTILLDNAESIREDFQQSLRRVMERYSRNTQFVVATRQPSKLIPPLKSRCFPVPMRAPSHEETVAVLERIVEREGVEYDADGLEYVAGYGGGDLRKAILGAQTAHEQAGAVTMQSAYEALGDVGVDDRVGEMLDAADAGEFADARSTLDDLVYDEGYAGEEILRDVLEVARGRYSGEKLARVYALAGEVDLDLTEGTSARVHLGHLLAELGR